MVDAGLAADHGGHHAAGGVHAAGAAVAGVAPAAGVNISVRLERHQKHTKYPFSVCYSLSDDPVLLFKASCGESPNLLR